MLISVLTTNPVIAAIGECLGRGTIISIILVLFVLPQILVLGDSIIERTSFEMKGIGVTTRTASGTMHVNGRVRGYINGVVDAEIKGSAAWPVQRQHLHRAPKSRWMNPICTCRKAT